jgi:hypothetical protein
MIPGALILEQDPADSVLIDECQVFEIDFDGAFGEASYTSTHFDCRAILPNVFLINRLDDGGG